MPTRKRIDPNKIFNRTVSGITAASKVPLKDPKDFLKTFEKKNNFYILSIDGGGARGMIPAVILKEIERRSGKPISKLFDRICGTSTGSILSCGLTAPKSVGRSAPKFSAANIVEIYRTLGQEVFSRGSLNESVIQPLEELLGHKPTWFATHANKAYDTIKTAWERLNRPLHDVHKLAYILHDKFGDLSMKDALTELFVYAYDVGSRTPEILGSSESTIPGARDYSKFRMYQAATASSAAVPFFGPYAVWANPNPPHVVRMPIGSDIYPPSGGRGDQYELVDGGNGALGNPSLFSMLEETPASKGKNKIVLSLGTGHATEPIPAKTKAGGFVQWLAEGALLNCAFDGEADVTDMAMRQMLERDVSYFRWQPEIPKSMAFLDEGSREDMNALEDMAQAFIAQHDEDIDNLIAILK